MTETADQPQLDDALAPHALRLRNQERIEMIMAFYRGLKLFRDYMRRSHAVGRRFHFDDMDQIIEEDMRLVKDSCHRLFRASKRGESDRLLQAVFDMYFGILFHILLKAKENIRLQENYNIRRLEKLMDGLRQAREVADLPPGVGLLFDRLTKEFERDSEELDGEMERARFMFGQLEKIFNHIIQVYRDNPTIIRGLYCHKSFFAELFPAVGIDRVFARIYPRNGPAEAYFLLGFDFLRSGHMDEAREAFAVAIKAVHPRRLAAKRTRRLYDHYRQQLLSPVGAAGDFALAIRLRLREIERHPSLRALLADENDRARGAGGHAASNGAARSPRRRRTRPQPGVSPEITRR